MSRFVRCAARVSSAVAMACLSGIAAGHGYTSACVLCGVSAVLTMADAWVVYTGRGDW